MIHTMFHYCNYPHEADVHTGKTYKEEEIIGRDMFKLIPDRKKVTHSDRLIRVDIRHLYVTHKAVEQVAANEQNCTAYSKHSPGLVSGENKTQRNNVHFTIVLKTTIVCLYIREKYIHRANSSQLH